jgi:plastocyanin
VTPTIAGLICCGGPFRRLERSLLLALVCGWGAVCPASVTLAAWPADKPATHTVTIEGVAYQPKVLVVNRGDTVVWVNKDPFPHTVTAAAAFDSHDIPAGATWKYVARKAGSFQYICTLHPNMQGTLRVQ